MHLQQCVSVCTRRIMQSLTLHKSANAYTSMNNQSQSCFLVHTHTHTLTCTLARSLTHSLAHTHTAVSVFVSEKQERDPNEMPIKKRNKSQNKTCKYTLPWVGPRFETRATGLSCLNHSPLWTEALSPLTVWTSFLVALPPPKVLFLNPRNCPHVTVMYLRLSKSLYVSQAD